MRISNLFTFSLLTISSSLTTIVTATPLPNAVLPRGKALGHKLSDPQTYCGVRNFFKCQEYLKEYSAAFSDHLKEVEHVKDQAKYEFTRGMTNAFTEKFADLHNALNGFLLSHPEGRITKSERSYNEWRKLSKNAAKIDEETSKRSAALEKARYSYEQVLRIMDRLGLDERDMGFNKYTLDFPLFEDLEGKFKAFLYVLHNSSKKTFAERLSIQT